jgi:hypothetical protein
MACISVKRVHWICRGEESASNIYVVLDLHLRKARRLLALLSYDVNCTGYGEGGEGRGTKTVISSRTREY